MREIRQEISSVQRQVRAGGRLTASPSMRTSQRSPSTSTRGRAVAHEVGLADRACGAHDPDRPDQRARDAASPAAVGHGRQLRGSAAEAAPQPALDIGSHIRVLPLPGSALRPKPGSRP